MSYCLSGITNTLTEDSSGESDEEEEDGGAVYQGVPVNCWFIRFYEVIGLSVHFGKLLVYQVQQTHQ